MHQRTLDLLQVSCLRVVLGLALFAFTAGAPNGSRAALRASNENAVVTSQEGSLPTSDRMTSNYRLLAAQVGLEPSISSIHVGQLSSVSLKATHVSDLGSYRFWLYFDSSVVAVEQVQDNGFLGSTGRSVITDQQNGTDFVFFEAWSTGARRGPSSEEAVLANIVIRARQVGTSNLDLRDVVLRDILGSQQELEEPQDGSVEVGLASLYLPLVGNSYCTPDRYEPNNSFAEAKALMLEIPITANICPITDTWDVFFLEIETLDKITVDLTNMAANTNFDIFLHNDNRDLVDWSTNEGNTDERIDYEPQKTGKYYIVVYRNPEVGHNVGPYTLRVEYGGKR